MARGKHIITALDIGTTTVRAIIARHHPQHGIQILGVGMRPSAGMRKSTILDGADMAKVISNAVEDAEREASVEARDIIVNISGGHIQSCTTAAIVNILETDETIQERHLNDLLEKARANVAEKGREVLHAIPQEYRLDGHGGIVNPRGLQAARIEGSVHIITADRTIMENHARVVNDAGFHVAELCFNAIADGHCVLSDQEKKDGVLIVDCGGGATAYTVYFNGNLHYSNVFAVGGDHVTNDLALGLNLSTAQAEELKCTYARCIRYADAAKDPDTIRIGTDDKTARAVLRQDVEMIINSRIEELLQFVRDNIEQHQVRPLLARGVVFVGGATGVYGFKEHAERLFNCPVRIAVPHVLGPDDTRDATDIWSERHEFLRDTSCATVLGLLRHAALMRLHAAPKTSIWKRLFS